VSVDDGDTAEQPAGKSLRLALLMLGLTAVGALAIGYVMRPAPPTRMLTSAAAVTSRSPTRAPRNELTYRANTWGHFVVVAEVNGASVRFVVDTGASYLSLTPKDAAAIGISLNNLDYNLRMNTAKGTARAAEVRLREVRIGQLTIEDVPAIVMEDPSGISLLGMSFLNRLEGHRISNGVLTMEW
jgi:aspartyl protease family protein